MNINCRNVLNLDKQQLERAVAMSCGIVKLVCGVGNSAAHLVMLNAHDKIKQHPAYKQRVKKAYREAMSEMDAYRRGLMHPTGVRFFHLNDLPAESRKKFAADATDAEYFAFWEASGAQAYERTKPFITSLWNKYRVSLVRHDTPHADLLAHAMTAAAALNGAQDLYRRAIDDCMYYGLTREFLEMLFSPFSLKRVCKAWERALFMTEPHTDTYDLDEIEERNIAMGLNQLRDEWINPEHLYGSTIANIEDYGEIFASKGQQKKSIRNMKELLQETNEELRKQLKK